MAAQTMEETMTSRWPVRSPARILASMAGGAARLLRSEVEQCKVFDPQSGLFVVFMMQSPKQRVPHRALLRNRVCGALTQAQLPGTPARR